MMFALIRDAFTDMSTTASTFDRINCVRPKPRSHEIVAIWVSSINEACTRGRVGIHGVTTIMFVSELVFDGDELCSGPKLKNGNSVDWLIEYDSASLVVCVTTLSD